MQRARAGAGRLAMATDEISRRQFATPRNTLQAPTGMEWRSGDRPLPCSSFHTHLAISRMPVMSSIYRRVLSMLVDKR